MSVTVKIYQMVQVDVGGEIKSLGSITTPLEYTAATEEVFDVRAAVTNAVADASGDYVRQVLWVEGYGGVSDFDALFFECDADCLLELTCDKDGDSTGPTYSTIKVPVDATVGKGRLFIAGDDLVQIITTDGTVTTMLRIDQIAVQNPSAIVNTVNVRLILIT